MDDQNRNLIIATVLSFVVILGWALLFPPEEQAPNQTPPAGQSQTEDGALPPPQSAEGSAEAPETGAGPQAVDDGPSVAIDTPDLEGAIALTGGRLDRLSLKQYQQNNTPDSPIVTLLRPVGQPNAYYALFGWAPGGTLTYDDVPGAQTPWELVEGERLTPDNPVTLEWQSPAGLTFRRTISVDEHYMFAIAQEVTNNSEEPRRLAPYGTVARHGEPQDLSNFFILHEGAIRVADDELSEVDYDDMTDLDPVATEGGNAELIDVTDNGWIGFTDKYWMTTLIPDAGSPFRSVMKYVPGADIYQTEIRQSTIEIAPGETADTSMRVFAGAKEWDLLRQYQSAGIDRFVDAIDWGWFFFLTKPIFAVLHWLNLLIGNMGWSIILLTLLIKAILFPLAYKSYVSMAKMKDLQPEMEKIKEKSGDDRQKLQQEMMKLYKDKKVNPAAGCLPLLLQIPIFFSLYKVIFVTLELRHAPWIGWIDDLSAPDPSSILNLFGLLPYAPPDATSILAILSLGILPILLGISMWLQQKLNPAPADPTQAMIFAWMPWVFMFMLGQFASGLVLYWIANNTITFAQQYGIMRSQGMKPDVFGNIRRSLTRAGSGGK